MYNDDLPPELLLAIQNVLNTENASERDPLEDISSNFDSPRILNSFFPDEASLANTEAVHARLVEKEREFRRQIDALEAQLRKAQDPDKMQVIQEMISELLTQMTRIREKATESEAVVRNITKDIQVLDMAKRNLISSMTTMKRLQMLVNALAQLEGFLQERKYRDIAQTLSAVKEISASFKSWISIPRISQVWRRIQDVQGRIRTVVEADFDAFYIQDPAKGIKPSLIADACHVVDVLGPDVRANLIGRYVALEVKEYRRIFKTSDEAGQLDNISRRFAWFRRALQTHEAELGRAFPSEWKVGWHLLAKFVDITRDDISGLLSKAGSDLTVKTLLDNLQSAAEFEASVVKKWNTPLSEMLAVTSRNPKSMVSAFEPHMGVFIDAQDKAISDMLAPHRKSKATPRPTRASLDTNTSSEGHDVASSSKPTVLPSSTELFYFYGQSLEQCSKLSTGKPLFDLCNVLKKWLKIYAEEILSVGGTKRLATQAIRKSMDSRADPAEIQNIALVINTADYCYTTSSELEDSIRAKVDDEFKDRVTLQAARDQFVAAISSGINALLQQVEAACEPSFLTMSRTIWSNLKQVSGPSLYSGELVQAADQVIETIKPLIEQKRYLRNLFDKTSSVLLAKFTNALVKSRPLKEIGSEQLLIDLQIVKSYLMKMPGDELVTTSYTRGLTKSTERLESLLKVVVTPADPPEGFILNYTLLIGDASYSNFQKILDLKGTPKSEQGALLDSFLTITSTKELESTSFLSSLDMDPQTLGHLGTLASPLLPGTENVASSIFGGLASPTPSGPPTGNSPGILGGGGGDSRSGSGTGDQTPRREVFSDFKRFVSFGLRRDSLQPS